MKPTIYTLFLFILFTLIGCNNFSNLVHIENNTEIQFSEVTISVCDSLWVIRNMAPNEKHDFTIVYDQDDSYHITAITDTNDSITGDFGYVTHGIAGDRVWITLEDNAIAFRQSSSGSY